MTEIELENNLKSRFWRLNNLYWIMDDHGRKIKFKLNKAQYFLYKTLWWLNVILKSRQHGITTFICLFFLDACLFGTNVRAGIVAHKLDAAKVIFHDKVKFAYTNLPEVLKERIKLIDDSKMAISFSNGSFFYVSTSMRSGTLQYLHISEYSYTCQHSPAKAKEIKAGAGETVHEGGYVIYESTADGFGDDWEDMCKEAEKKKEENIKLTRLDYAYHFFPWFLKEVNVLREPVEISPFLEEYFNKIQLQNSYELSEPQKWWYAKKFESLGDLIYGQHPSNSKEAFRFNIEGTYYGDKLIRADKDGRIGHYPFDSHYPVYSFSDFGPMYTATLFAQFRQGRIRLIGDYWDCEGQGAPGWANVLKAKKQYNYFEHIAGPDMNPIGGSNRRDFGAGKLIKDVLLELGFTVKPCVKHDFAGGIRTGRDYFDLVEIDEEGCPNFLLAAAGYRREKDLKRSTDSNIEYQDQEAKTWHRHLMDAWRHLSVMYQIHKYTGDTIAGLYDYTPARKEGENEGVTDLLEV